MVRCCDRERASDVVRHDPALIEALSDSVTYVYDEGWDDTPARRESARAVGMLWYDAPNPPVEPELTCAYLKEDVSGVRTEIVSVLCEHGYDSSATKAAIEDATRSYDGHLASESKACLADMQR